MYWLFNWLFDTVYVYVYIYMSIYNIRIAYIGNKENSQKKMTKNVIKTIHIQCQIIIIRKFLPSCYLGSSLVYLSVETLSLYVYYFFHRNLSQRRKTTK